MTKSSGISVLVCFAIVIFSSMHEVQAGCAIGVNGILCLNKYKDMNWTNFNDVAKSAGSPTKMIQWTDSQREDWIKRLNSACLPFNQVGDCTAKNGGRRWWECMDNEQISGLLEQLPEDPSGAFPNDPDQLRGQFEALADLCEPTLASDFTRDQPCMRGAFAGITTGDLAAYKDQLIKTDDQIANKTSCYKYNCKGAFVYNGMFDYVINSGCQLNPAETAHHLINPFLRLNMQSGKLFCSDTDFPTDFNAGNYLVKPTKNPVELLENCGGGVQLSTTTTAKPSDSSGSSTAKTSTQSGQITGTRPDGAPPAPPPTTTTKRRPGSAGGGNGGPTTEETAIEMEVDAEGFNILPRKLDDYDLEFLDISDGAPSNNFVTTRIIITLFVFSNLMWLFVY